ncbi:MAG: hypothetical protein M3Y81_24135 [Chloroflexota bacterium]|nr:hypothetical protein [Chloroflexota bacterium]
MKKKVSYWAGRAGITLLGVTIVLTAFASLPKHASAAMSLPDRASAAGCPSGMSCGSYSIPGLGARKQQILKAGASTLDLAVAMLETNTMQATYASGDGKTTDAANFGIFKQDWYMLRSACSRFLGLTSSQYAAGAFLNSSLSTDVACMNQSQRHYGLSTWFAGERYGQTGIGHPNTPDILRYTKAIYWLQSQLTSRSANLSNDTRFWVAVPAI